LIHPLLLPKFPCADSFHIRYFNYITLIYKYTKKNTPFRISKTLLSLPYQIQAHEENQFVHYI